MEATTEKTTQLTPETDHIVIDAEDNYVIRFEPSEYQLINVGFNSRKAGARLSHPNILETRKVIHEFKHYLKNGGKRWTAKSGVNHIIAVHKNNIYIEMEKGYSYVHAIINGVKVTLNVSGGTGGNGWTDYVGSFISISVDHKVSDFKKLLAIAETENLDVEIPACSIEFDEDRWNELHAKSDTKRKDKIYAMIENEEGPTIYLDNCVEESVTGISLCRASKWSKPDENGSRVYGRNGRIKSLIGCGTGSSRYRIKLNQIDWAKTFKENGLDKNTKS